MTRKRHYLKRHSFLGTGFLTVMSLCILVVAGCSKPDESANTPSGPPPGGQMNGPGGRGGGPGGGMRGGGPVAENATGAEIYQAKCGCHGPGGKGGRAPVLTSVGSRSDSELYTIIHDGRKKMPAFGTQLSEAQIKKVVTYLKQLPSS